MKKLLIVLFFCLIFQTLQCQNLKAINNNIGRTLNSRNNSHGLFKSSLIFAFTKGFSVGASYGMWQENPTLQYSLNTGCMWRVGKGFLGNFRDGAYPHDSRSKSQFVFMFTPMLTTALSDREFFYQELEPFYLGTPNAVFCKYKHSFTLGSTFTISPRGTYHNVSTVRNRAQQDFVIGLNLGNFNFTIYDDFFPFLTSKLQLGDNWDRFFTGGGFIRYRFSDEFTLHLYSEVYTGINRANAFLYPDVISYKRKRGGIWRQKNYANQDPGQEYFNSSWFIAKLSYSAPYSVADKGVYVPDIDFMLGSSATWTMFSQNLVHNLIGYDPNNHLKLHYFLPRANVPGNLEAGGKHWYESAFKSLFLGGGVNYNILPN
jgi:hypothetical protein